MTTHFIEAEVTLQDSPVKTRGMIETELETWGEPLRWAVTSVDVERQTAHVEAVVTTVATKT